MFVEIGNWYYDTEIWYLSWFMIYYIIIDIIAFHDTLW